MTDAPQTSAFREFLELVGNVRLGIVLLVVVAVASVLGTVVLQDPTGEYSGALREYYDGPDGDEADRAWYAPSYDLLKTLHLSDVYHAPWFHALLALLAANVLAVTALRFSLRPARWGFVLSHVGVLLTLLGGLIWFAFGDKGTVRLMPGETVERYGSSRDGTYRALGFPMRLDRFETERYAPTLVFEGADNTVVATTARVGETFALPRGDGTLTVAEMLSGVRPIMKALPRLPRMQKPTAVFHVATPRGAEIYEARSARRGSDAELPVRDFGWLAVAFDIDNQRRPEPPAVAARLFVLNVSPDARTVLDVDVAKGTRFLLPSVEPMATGEIIGIDNDVEGAGPALRLRLSQGLASETRRTFAWRPRFDPKLLPGERVLFPEIRFVYYRPEVLLWVVETAPGAYALRRWTGETWSAEPLRHFQSVETPVGVVTFLGVRELSDLDAVRLTLRLGTDEPRDVWITTADDARRLTDDLAVLCEPSLHVRDYRGRVTFDPFGDAPVTETMRVNHPTRFRNTRVYLARPGQPVELLIVRNPGLGIAVVGLVLMTLGVFAACFLKPVLLRRRSRA